jgi:hypothetical protein
VQGVTVLAEVAMSAKIMIVTLVAYFIISGPSWAKSPGSTHTAALVTAIVCFLMLAAYCAQQVLSSMGESTVGIKNEKKLELMAQETALKQLKAQAAVVAAVQFLSKKKVAPADNMKAPLLQKSQEEQEASAKLSAGKAALKWKTKVLGMEAAHLVSVLFLSSDLILYFYTGRHLQRHIVATAGSSCC